MGFKKIYVIIMHQGMEAPLALAFKKASAELAFEGVLEKGYPRGWWGDEILKDEVGSVWGQIEVQPMILSPASPPAGGDHAGYNETSFLLATCPELVEQDQLDDDAPWYCRQDEEKNSWTANPHTDRLWLRRSSILGLRKFLTFARSQKNKANPLFRVSVYFNRPLRFPA